MAMIRKREDRKDSKVSYQAVVRVKGFPQASKTFKRKKDAQKWAARVESEIEAGEYAGHSEAAKRTVDELFTRYIDTELPKLRDGRNPKRQLGGLQERLVGKPKRRFGDFKLKDVQPAIVVEIRDQLAAEKTTRGVRSPATVNRNLAVLSSVFNTAKREWQWANKNPVADVKKLKEPPGRTRFLSDDEREALLAACEEIDKTLRLLVVLALSTGCRRGELENLRWPEVDFKNGFARIAYAKNGDSRFVPIVGYAAELLKVHAKVRDLHNDLVFPTPDDPSKPRNFESAWRKARDKAELDDFKFHDLRHSAASEMARNGASLAELASFLGHKSLLMVGRYSHLAEGHLTDKVAEMNASIFGAGKEKSA